MAVISRIHIHDDIREEKIREMLSIIKFISC